MKHLIEIFPRASFELLILFFLMFILFIVITRLDTESLSFGIDHPILERSLSLTHSFSLYAVNFFCFFPFICVLSSALNHVSTQIISHILGDNVAKDFLEKCQRLINDPKMSEKKKSAFGNTERKTERND
jgi:hypothetical protein